MAVMEEVCLDLAQLHGDQNPDVAVTLGPERVIKVFWPEAQPNDELLRLMDLWKDLATYFLFDAGSSGGGHGRGINTSLPVSPKPYFLAGRIDPAKARGLWPSDDPMLAGFDLNSGLEKSPGVKDHVVLKSFLPWR
jgi:phosphoribosylanthranilate isomerase